MVKKALKKGDEVVIVNHRRFFPKEIRTGVVQEVHQRGVYLEGYNGFISKSMLHHRNPNSERLGIVEDILDKLESEREEARLKALAPINERFDALQAPIRQEIKELWEKLNAK